MSTSSSAPPPGIDTSGNWWGLDHPDQAPRYQAIARMVTTIGARSVLDVGCGTAVLRAYLPREVIYTGFDPCVDAVARSDARATVICATAKEFDAGEARWDCIIWNEVLYYCGNPERLLSQYAQYLQPGGSYIVSVYQKRAHWLRWLRHYAWVTPSTGDAPSNRQCTALALRFFQEHHWQISQDQIVRGVLPIPWRILMASPGLIQSPWPVSEPYRRPKPL